MFDPASEFKIQNIENNSENKFSKKKSKPKIINILRKLYVFIVFFILFSFLTIGPLLFDFLEAKWYIKLLMIIGSLYSFMFILIVPAIFYESTKSKKVLFYFSPVFLFFLISIIGYINFDIWGQKNLLIGISFVWILFVGLYGAIKVLFNKHLGSETILNTLISLAILSFVIALLNQKINSDISDVYYKISIGIVYIIILAIYINKYVYKEHQKNKIISNIIGIVFWGSLLIVFFPFYIKWCGLKGEDFNTFITIYSALVGGGITLAGVAWTIKNNYNDKASEEIKKNIPYITIVPYKFAKKSFNICLTFGKNIGNKGKDDYKEYIDILTFYIKNISNTIITMESIKIGEKFYKFDKRICFEKNMIVMIKCCSKELFDSKQRKIEFIELFMKNSNNEEYSSKCNLKLYSQKEESVKQKIKSYIVTEILFPERVDK